MNKKILFFKRFPFEIGQRIHLEDGPRKGDWEVAGVDEKKVTLRCPVSGYEAHWDRFCYFVEEKQAAWPSAE
ncbi:MAG: hypothetical protein M8357_15390 [Desulfobulbaceae bacterium]|nr:hypothetical protein [Desulfobulbaceae bacterium]